VVVAAAVAAAVVVASEDPASGGVELMAIRKAAYRTEYCGRRCCFLFGAPGKVRERERRPRATIWSVRERPW
jgi:hypothetical protein